MIQQWRASGLGKRLAALVGVVLLLVFGLLAYLGVFKSVVVSKIQSQALVFSYSRFNGPLSKIGSAFAAHAQSLLEAGVLMTPSDCRGIGVYLSPEKEGKIEALVGCRFEGQAAIDLEITRKGFGMHDYQIMKLAPMEGVLKTDFPYRGFGIRLPISYFLAPAKVYPAFAKELGGEMSQNIAIEIYEENDSRIDFWIPSQGDSSRIRALAK